MKTITLAVTAAAMLIAGCGSNSGNHSGQAPASSQQVTGALWVFARARGGAVVVLGAPGVNSSGGRVTGHFTVPQRRQ